MVDVMVPSVTVKLSSVSESASSVAVMVMVCVAPAAEFAANVTVPDVADRSAALRGVGGSEAPLHATWTSAWPRPCRQGDGEGRGVTALGDTLDRRTRYGELRPSPSHQYW